MGVNIFEIIENGETLASTRADIYDFVPVVKIINKKEKNKTILIEEDNKNETINLGVDISEDYRNYKIPNISITKNEAILHLKIYNGNPESGFTDDDGLIEFAPSNENVTIEYDSKVVKYGEEIKIKIKHNLKISESFHIDIKGKDDKNDFIKSSDKVLISGKLNFLIKEFLYDIPGIVLCNFDCIDNCEYTSELVDDPVLIWDEGIKNPLTKKGLELFSKTKTGQSFLKLFLDKGTNLFSFSSQEKGKFYNKHCLIFIENDYKNNFGHTEYGFRNRFPYYKSIKFSEFILKKFNLNLKKFQLNPDKFFMSIEIHLYINQYIKSQERENWSEKRLVAAIAHTIAHEIFIHAYRKGILCMESWENNFENFTKIYRRDTGNHGDNDHADYIQNKKDKGLNLMRDFQKELKNIIGVELFGKVKKYHDKKYNNLKKS